MRARIARPVVKVPPRPRYGMSPKHEETIRCLPCLRCGAPPRSDPHHLQRGLPTKERGMGWRAADRYLVPLCRGCHTWVESTGDDEAQLASIGITGRYIALALWTVRGDAAAMLRVVERSLQLRGRALNA